MLPSRIYASPHVLTGVRSGPLLRCCVLALQLADALVEHETLDAEEVQKVIKGERIRAIDEVIKEDLSRLHEGVAPPQPRPPVLVSDP